jgi:hypothetical protein
MHKRWDNTAKIPWRAYRYNLNVALIIVVIVVLMTLNFLAVWPDSSVVQGLGLLLLMYAILAHVQDRKLKIWSVGSILIYISEVIGIPLIIMLITDVSLAQNIYFRLLIGTMVLTSLVLQIIGGSFCLVNALKIKKIFLKQKSKEMI